MITLSQAQTLTTAGLLNPFRASVGLTRPVKARLPSTSRATAAAGSAIGLGNLATQQTIIGALQAAEAAGGLLACALGNSCRPAWPVWCWYR